MAKQLINGKAYGWSSVNIAVSGAEDIEPTEISYDDEQEVEPLYGKKGNPRGFGTGNKKNSVKLSMNREDFNELCDAAIRAGAKAFYNYVIPKITVSYADDGARTCTDVLTKVKISKRSFKNAVGDKEAKVELDAIAAGGIKINGMDA